MLKFSFRVGGFPLPVGAAAAVASCRVASWLPLKMSLFWMSEELFCDGEMTPTLAFLV